MLAVVKMPHTEIALHGEGAKEVLECLKERFAVQVLSQDHERLVPVHDSDYWQHEVTPGSLLMGFRLKHGLTQQALAQRAGMAQVMVSEYETGRRRLTRKAAMKFAEALNEPVEKFFP